MAKYSEMLHDPNWIRKREQILKRDNYRCVSCNNKGSDAKQLGENLNVHHKHYRKGLLPWQYEDKDLITLCDDCHKFITDKINSCNELIGEICTDDDTSEQLEYLLTTVLEINNPWRTRRIAKNIQHG